MLKRNIYRDGAYLDKNPLWHTDESPFKVKQILRMLRKNHLQPTTICDVGCGAGEVLRLLQEEMDNACRFWGYEFWGDTACWSWLDEQPPFPIAARS